MSKYLSTKFQLASKVEKIGKKRGLLLEIEVVIKMTGSF